MGQFILTKPGTTSIEYIATGGEGNKIPLPSLLGRTIQLVTYNTLTMIPESDPPDAQGWFYQSNASSPDFGDLIFGFDLNATDVVQILFR
jgi:hypothetical protein